MRNREDICFLSDSFGRNLVDVNERQLVLIKNEIASLLSMELHHKEIMINFCWLKTLLCTPKLLKQQGYNCSDAKVEEKQ